MTLIGILNHITQIWYEKRPQNFWIFLKTFVHSVLLWAVWPYFLRYSQTYLIIYDMFLNCQTCFWWVGSPESYFHFISIFHQSSSHSKQNLDKLTKFVKYIFSMKSNLLFIFTINNGAKQNWFPYLKSWLNLLCNWLELWLEIRILGTGS